MSIEQWWAMLEKSGWLDEVPAGEAERIKAEANEYADDIAWAFNALAGTGFDGDESIENDGDYTKSVVAVYADSSNGAFAPTNAKDVIDWDGGIATLTFDAGGKAHRIELQQEGYSVAGEIHDSLNEVMATLGGKQRFFMLPTDDQTCGLVCVTPDTYERARELGLIPKQEDWPPSEEQ